MRQTCVLRSDGIYESLTKVLDDILFDDISVIRGVAFTGAAVAHSFGILRLGRLGIFGPRTECSNL